MMALSIVVIASLVGAGGLGDVVLKSLRQLKVGEALEGGLAIVAMAILLDRLSAAISRISYSSVERHQGFRLLPAGWAKYWLGTRDRGRLGRYVSSLRPVSAAGWRARSVTLFAPRCASMVICLASLLAGRSAGRHLLCPRVDGLSQELGPVVGQARRRRRQVGAGESV